jgi:predicted glycosyltransferase
MQAMKVLIDMGHPAHVHFFKNTIWELEKRGHEVKVTARDNCTFNTFAQPPITPL